jgi:hypothetical protein
MAEQPMRRTMPIVYVGIDESRCDELVPGIDLAIDRSVEGRPDKNDSVVLVDDYAVADELMRSACMTDDPACLDCNSHSNNPLAATPSELAEILQFGTVPVKKTSAEVLGHLVGKREDLWRNFDPKSFRSLEIDDQLELDGQIDSLAKAERAKAEIFALQPTA